MEAAMRTAAERQVILRAARAMELAAKYIRTGRTQDALRVLILAAEAARDDLKELRHAAQRRYESD